MANVARLDLDPMSSGPSASGNSSGGGKRPKSGEFPAVSEAAVGSAAIKPASISPDAPDIDSGWDETGGSAKTAIAPSGPSDSPVSAQALAPKRVIVIGGPTPSQSTDKPATAGSTKERRRQIEPAAKYSAQRASSPPTEPKPEVVLLDQRDASNALRRASAAPTEPKPEVALLNKRDRANASIARAKAQSARKPHALAKGVEPSALKKLLTEGPESDFSHSDIARLVCNVMGGQEVAKAAEKDQTSAVISAPTAPVPSALTTTDTSVPQSTAASNSTALITKSPSSSLSTQVSESVMEPDAWDVVVEAPPTPKEPQPSPAVVEQKPVKPQGRAKISAKPAVKSTKISEKPHQISKAKKADASEKAKSHSTI